VVAVSVLVQERPLVVVATNGEARQWGVQARDLIREASTVLGAPSDGGDGGAVLELTDVGEPAVAQGAGGDPGKVAEALRRIEHSVGERVTSRG